MKALTRLVIGAALLAPLSVSAQELRSPVTRADVSATIGSLHVHTEGVSEYDDWQNSVFFSSVGGGWYWTDHMKTVVEFGKTSDWTVYSSRPVTFTGQTLFVPTTFTSDARRFTLAHQFQFGRNQWVHPYAGLGLDVVAQRTGRRDLPVSIWDPIARRERLVQSGVDYPRRTTVKTYALATVGAKTYVHRRVFLVTDLRVAFASRAESILLRLGAGVDF